MMQNGQVAEIRKAAEWAAYENAISNGFDIAAGAQHAALVKIADVLEAEGAEAAQALADEIGRKAQDQMNWDLNIRPNAGRQAAVRQVRQILAADQCMAGF